MHACFRLLLVAVCPPVLLLAGCPMPEDSGPVAAFSASPAMGTAPVAIQFSNNSILPVGATATYQWGFGDGVESTDRSPSHTYEIPGEYAVILTVTAGTRSDSERKEAYISVLPAVAEDDSTPIAFADANLEAAIRESMGLPNESITLGDAREIVSLQIAGTTITDLDGLQHFTNLQVLRISGGYDSQFALDLAPLSGLAKLTELYPAAMWFGQDFSSAITL